MYSSTARESHTEQYKLLDTAGVIQFNLFIIDQYIHHYNLKLNLHLNRYLHYRIHIVQPLFY